MEVYPLGWEPLVPLVALVLGLSLGMCLVAVAVAVAVAQGLELRPARALVWAPELALQPVSLTQREGVLLRRVLRVVVGVGVKPQQRTSWMCQQMRWRRPWRWLGR